MFFLIYGEDGFRSRRALQAARAKFQKDRDAAGFNVVRLKAEDGLIRTQEELFASPFLAEKKMLILEGFCSLPKKDQEQLTEIIGRKPDSTVVVFFEETGADKLAKSPLFELLAKQKYSQAYPLPSPAEANRFAVAEAADGGVRFETPALRRLIETAGTDSWRIHEETAKLAAHTRAAGRETITVSDVDELVSGSREESVFAYIDACTDGHGQKAMTTLNGLLSAGEVEIQIVALLQRHFRLIALARDLMSRGVPQPAAVAKLGVHPFAAQKAWNAALRYDSRFLGQTIRRLAQMEQDLKTGATRPRVSLDLFTTDLTTKACALKKPRA